MILILNCVLRLSSVQDLPIYYGATLSVFVHFVLLYYLIKAVLLIEECETCKTDECVAGNISRIGLWVIVC